MNDERAYMIAPQPTDAELYPNACPTCTGSGYTWKHPERHAAGMATFGGAGSEKCASCDGTGSPKPPTTAAETYAKVERILEHVEALACQLENLDTAHLSPRSAELIHRTAACLRDDATTAGADALNQLDADEDLAAIGAAASIAIRAAVEAHRRRIS